MMTLSFLNNPDLLSLNGPKTPSPVPKTKVLDVADQLLSIAEKEFTSVEAKISSDNILTAKSSSRHTSELPSSRRIMTDAPSSPTKGSVFSDSTLKTRSKTNYRVPQNSPSSVKNKKSEEKYKENNGEKKNVKPKPCPHQRDLKSASYQSEQSKISKGESSNNNLEKVPTFTEFSMFYEQQQLVERKTQSIKEKNSATVIFKSDAKVISSTDVVRRDIQTNTDPDSANLQSRNPKFTPNSSIISMKTSKPEVEEPQVTSLSGKMLNVQKMPSVNIRPGFSVQHGPKINIVGSSSSMYKPKRKNTEFYDVVYPPVSPVFSESSLAGDYGRQARPAENHIEYVCERHTFPSGKLIPGTFGDDLRQSHQKENLTLDEKKDVLVDLIKSVTDKIEKQANNEKKSCCRLTYSLPLLASVVKKIQVDCGKCVDVLHSHLDRLVILMKEELRGYKELSGDHCCQLDETVHYQIVELELMQEENFKRQTARTLTVMRHKESEDVTKVLKKTVSFESIPDETARSSLRENTKPTVNPTLVHHISGKKNVPKTTGMRTKTSLKNQQPNTIKSTKNVAGSSTTKKNNDIKLKQSQCDTKRMGSAAKNINPILKKTNVSARTNEGTVVGQVLKNLLNKKSILKHGSNSKSAISNRTNKNNKDSNAYIKIVDEKETSGEFDKWIQERSIKIRRIHEELNKMVAGSMERYLENQSSENRREEKVNRDKMKSTDEINTEREDQMNHEEGNRILIYDHEEGNEKMENHKLDSSHQEAVQDYHEDFEEDVDELSGINSSASENSFQRTLAEAENDSSSSSNVEIITDEELDVGEISATDEKGSNNNVVDKASSSDSKVSKINKETPLIQISLDHQELSDKDDCAKLEKVNIATSPIHFKSPRQSTVDVSVNTSLSGTEVKKTSIATSPVNIIARALSQVRSSSVQTESCSREVTVNNNDIPMKNATDKMELSVPSVKLNPTPIENILQVSVGELGENSLALHTSSSNQTLKLIVQLPTLPRKSNEEKRIIELDCSDQSGRDTGTGTSDAQKLRTESKRTPETNFARKSNDDKSLSEELNQCTVSPTNNSIDQKIKDIIEPTVSEVLKKIGEEKNNSLKSPAPLREDFGNVGLINSSTSSDLVKPNIILQTQHGLWTRCDGKKIFSIIDLEDSNPKVDSSNQTEAEKQNVCIQVSESVAGSMSEKAISVRLCNSVPVNSGRSYLEMLQHLPAEPVMSSRSYSTICRSSSLSSSSTSTSSRTKDEGSSHLMEKLSEGEVVPEPCNCNIGEVCEVCIPRLDLSFGELKTKKRNMRMVNISQSDSLSDHSKSGRTSVSLTNLPLHLEPRPNFSSVITSSVPDLTEAKSRTKNAFTDSRQNDAVQLTETAGKMVRNSNVKQFSEIANSVLSDLGKELQTFKEPRGSKYLFPKPPPPLPTMNFPSIRDHCDISSSDSSKSQSSLRSKKSFSSHKNKSRTPLVIKTPVETPRIDAVIEDPGELSTSSYQTSVTSVSVDNSQVVLFSHSSADASS